MAKNSIITRTKAAVNPASQRRGVRLARTMELILSVIDANVYPGPITGDSGAVSERCSGICSVVMARFPPLHHSHSTDLRIRIAHGGQIRGPRPGVHLCQECVAGRLRLEFGNSAAGVVEVAENDCLRGAGSLTGGQNLAVADAAVFFFRF